MALTDQEIFDSTDPWVNADSSYRNTIVLSMYSAIRVLALDVFEDRYEAFLLPQSFTSKSKKSLQRGLRDYKYSYVQQQSKEYLRQVLRVFEMEQGKGATIDMLEWIRNVEEPNAHTVENSLSTIHWKIQRKKIVATLSPRLERYFGILELLKEQFFATKNSQELWCDSPWDAAFYKKQERDYYGEMENTWEPGDWASSIAGTLYGKIAWENACQGNKPDQDELNAISQWMYDHTTTSSKSHENPAALYVSPILRAEYVRRGLIRE